MQKTRSILNKRIMITGGGSGGHISVAMGIIDELESRYSNAIDRVIYIGGDLAMVGEQNKKSLEQTLVEDRGYKFFAIRAGKLQRSLSFSTVALLFRSILGLIDSLKYIQRFKPDMVFCSGGYVSLPIAISAWFYKIPVYLHEQTAAVGLSNGLVAKLAKRVYITFPSSFKYFPKKKTVHTGNIIKQSIFEKTSNSELGESVKRMKQSNLPIVFISGGSQGSHKINSIVQDIMKYALLDYQIVLQTGDNQVFKDYDVITKEWMKLPKELKDRMHIIKYTKEIGYLFNTMDLFVGRSGANTVYELGVLKKQSIFIPIPWVTHNEQELNAKILVDCGIAKIIREGELTPDKLHREIKKSLSERITSIDKEKLEKTFITNAATSIVSEMLNS